MANFDAKAAAAAGYTPQEIYQLQQSIISAKTAGYSDAEIQAHLAGAPAPANDSAPASQNQSWYRQPALLGEDLATGAAVLAGIPGDLNDLTNRGAHALGLPSVAITLPTSSDMLTGTNKLGLTGHPTLAPTTPGERYTAVGVEALPAAAAAWGTGGGVIPALLGTVGSGEVSEFIHQLFPKNTWAPVVAGVLTSLGVGGVTGTLAKSKAVADAAEELGRSQAALKVARDAQHYGGRADELRATALEEASAAKLVAHKQLAGAVEDAGTEQAHQTFTATANSLGSATTMQEAGEHLQAGARNWLADTLPTKLDTVWAPVNTAIPPTMQMPLSQFTNALGKINTSAGELEPVAALMKPGLPAQLGAKLKAVVAAKALTGTPATFNWKDAQVLRSTLGDAMAEPMTVKAVGQKNLSKLYASLTTDMRVGADQAGATAEFDAANTESARLYDIAQGPMAKLVSGKTASLTDDPLPETAATSLLAGGKKGATSLAAIQGELPESISELASVHLRDPKFPFAKLSPEAQAVLVPNPQTREELLTSLLEKDQAAVNAKESAAQATRDHNERLAAIAEDKRTGTSNRSDAVWEATDARDAALLKAGTPVQSRMQKLATGAAQAGEAAAGGVIGSVVAPNLVHALGLSHGGPVAQNLLTVAGLAAPMIYRGGKAILANQNSLALPVAGAIAGGNTLTLPTGKLP